MTATSRPIDAGALTREGFAPFGDVLDGISVPEDAGRLVNFGTARRHDGLVALESGRADARPVVALYRCAPQPLPFVATRLERHPHSTQLFALLRGAGWLLLVAPSRGDGGPDEERARAFVCAPGQAVNLRRGLWHHPVLALGSPAELLMLAWEDGGVGDCEERVLARPLAIGLKR